MATETTDTLIKECKQEAPIEDVNQKIDDALWLRERQHLLIVRRSTFSEKKTLMIKPYFDKAIKLGADIVIPYTHFPAYRRETLYKIVTDSLLFLRMKLPEEYAKKYNTLKSRVRIEVDSEGVMIRFTGRAYVKETALKQLCEEDHADLLPDDLVRKREFPVQEQLPEKPARVTAKSAPTEHIERREDIAQQSRERVSIPTVTGNALRYADIAKDLSDYVLSGKGLKEWTGIKLTDEEQSYLRNVFRSVNLAAKVTETSIRVMRDE